MHASSVLAAIFMAGAVAARVCTNLTIPVDISSRQGLFNEIPFEGNLDVLAFSQRFTQTGQNYSQALLKEFQTLKGSYKIAATYCQPDYKTGSTIQLLIHGIGFDRTYWDLSYNNYNYSYVEQALASGYSTLAIDRLGIGNSSHGDPLNEIQAQAEVEALNAVTTKLRNGDIPEIGHSYDKIIHVGHSFGSIQAYWLSSLYPNNTDGIVLTGWSASGAFFPTTVSTWNLHSARLNQPLRFGNISNSKIVAATSAWKSGDALVSGISSVLENLGAEVSSQDIWNEFATTELGNIITGYNESVVPLDYPSGYITWSDFTANQYAFLYPDMYDLTFGLLGEATKHPMTAGELLTIGSFPLSTAFAGPVLVFTGERDFPFCGGDCYATGEQNGQGNVLDGAKGLFVGASVFETYVQPETAHGLNFHYNATEGYKVVQGWLGANGLGA